MRDFVTTRDIYYILYKIFSELVNRDTARNIAIRCFGLRADEANALRSSSLFDLAFNVQSTGTRFLSRWKTGEVSCSRDLSQFKYEIDSPGQIVRSMFLSEDLAERQAQWPFTVQQILKEGHKYAWSENVKSKYLEKLMPLGSIELNYEEMCPHTYSAFQKAVKEKMNSEESRNQFIDALTGLINELSSHIVSKSEAERRVRLIQPLGAEEDTDPTNAVSFDIETYIAELSSSCVFSDLTSRSDAGPALRTEQYVKRSLLNSQGEPLAECSLLDFSNGKRIKFLVARAGRGKTSVLRALLRSFDKEQNELSLRLGFAENDARKNIVPFYFAFSPHIEKSSARLRTGDYRAILEKIVLNGTVTLPDVATLEKDIDVLKERALFVFDSLDEADDWNMAIASIRDLAGRFPNARMIVSSRELAETPAFAYSADFISIGPMSLDEKLELTKTYLAHTHPECSLSDETLSVAAEALATNPYTAKASDVPLFASIAARDWDLLGDAFCPLCASKAFDDVLRSLRKKAINVLEAQYSNSKMPLKAHDLSRILGRIALVMFLEEHLENELPECSILTCEDDASTDVGCISRRRLGHLMEKAISNLDLPCETNGLEDFWRHFTIASGLMAFQPETESYCFDSREVELYLASRGLADILYSSQADCFDILADLMDSIEEPDVKMFVAMFMGSLETWGKDNAGKGGTANVHAGAKARGYSLMVLNLLLDKLKVKTRRAELVKYDQGKVNSVLMLLKDIESGRYHRSAILSYKLFGGIKMPYKEMLSSTIAAIETFIRKDKRE